MEPAGGLYHALPGDERRNVITSFERIYCAVAVIRKANILQHIQHREQRNEIL
jgi:hypothetical protein